eukprot:3808029-Rhodomonas_salina.1
MRNLMKRRCSASDAQIACAPRTPCFRHRVRPTVFQTRRVSDTACFTARAPVTSSCCRSDPDSTRQCQTA